MRVKVESIVQTYATSIALFLEDKTITLVYDGKKTWASTDFLEIADNTLDFLLRVIDLNGTEWKLTLIATTSSSNESKKYERTGTITRGQFSEHKGTLQLGPEVSSN